MTTCKQHTVCPSGYLAWHEWADKKSRRHYQVRCDECGLWAIWRRKPCSHPCWEKDTDRLVDGVIVEGKTWCGVCGDEL